MSLERMALTLRRPIVGYGDMQWLLDLGSMAAALLSPASAVAVALALWRLGADLGWTAQFAISSGLFSHWQVWMALSLLLAWASHHGHSVASSGVADDAGKQVRMDLKAERRKNSALKPLSLSRAAAARRTHKRIHTRRVSSRLRVIRPAF
jgi:hypothetical protein